MTTPSAAPAAYTLEQAQGDIANLRNQLTLLQSFVSTVSDKAVLLYAPGPNAIPRGPTSWSFEDGTVDGWGAANGAVTNSVVTATGWPTDGTHSLLLTANGAGQPQAFSPAALGTFVPSQPGDPVTLSVDIYCPAPLNHVYVAISWRDDTGGFISMTTGPDTVFTAGQVQTLTVNGTAPDLCAGFAVLFGDHNTDANGTLIYGDNVKVAGNLAISVSPGGGTDAVGNVYPRGISAGYPGVPQAILDWMDHILGVPAGVLAQPTNDPTESEVAELATRILGSGLTRSLASVLAGAKTTVRADNVDARFLSSTVDGTTTPATGFLVYTNAAATSDTMLSWSFGGINAVGVMKAAHPGATSASPAAVESWQTPALGTNFTSNGSPYAAVGYQLEPVNGGRVRLRGQVNLTANQAQFTTVFTLPAGYQPAHQQAFSLPNNLSGNVAGAQTILVLTTGALQLAVAGSNGNFLDLDGIVIELD